MRSILILSILLAISLKQFSQTRSLVTEENLSILDARQLAREPWFYSLDEAMRQPDKVYKLSLQHQQLKELPPEIIRFQNLQLLNLSHNKLKDVPESIGSLSRLQVLWLSHNRLNTLPEDMKLLQQLETLYISNNRLTQIPAWVGGLGKLREMEVSSNFLTTYELDMLEKRLPRCAIHR